MGYVRRSTVKFIGPKRQPRKAKYTTGVYNRAPTGKGMKRKPATNNLLHTPLLPLKRYGKLPYYESNTYSSGIATAGGYVFSANGLYDPNITGLGHQPMGFDQMMLFYEHYTVTSCKITCNFIIPDPSFKHCVVGMLIAPDATLETNIGRLNENGMLVKKIMSPSTQSTHCSLSMTLNLSKINGKKDVKSEDDFRGDVAANPVEQTYIHLYAYDPQLTNAVTVLFDCVLEYSGVFTEPRKLIQS